MSSSHSVESLETTDVPDSNIPLPSEAQRLITHFVEGVVEGQRSELLVSRNTITGKLPASQIRSPSPRLLTGSALRIGTPVVTPTQSQTTPIPPNIPTTTTTTITTTPSTPTPQSFLDPNSPHHSSSSSESSDSSEYLSDCSPNRIATSGLSTDTLIVALMNRLRSEEPHLTSHKRSIFQSLLAYLSVRGTQLEQQAEIVALQKRIQEFDQQCRLTNISRRRDDQDLDDHPEGENIRDIREGHETEDQVGQQTVHENVQEVVQNQEAQNQELAEQLRLANLKELEEEEVERQSKQSSDPLATSSQIQSVVHQSSSHIHDSDSDDLPLLVRHISHYYSTTSSSDESCDPDPFQPGNANNDDSDYAPTSEAIPQSQHPSQEEYRRDVFEAIVYHLRNT
uniref:transcriptional regulator of yeast form adherence 4-like n=1 Tax=Erigeron canadensis TaxID=72917 RepID=UPI001CB942E7|nr:transcriptional regulator of yeast form adherence 4-like [Erigeron canadensis]